MTHYDVSILPSEARYWVMIIWAVVGGFLLVKYFDNLLKRRENLISNDLVGFFF